MVREDVFITREVLNLRVIEMVISDRKRSGGVLVPTLLLFIITNWATCVIMVVNIFGHKVPNLRQANVSQFLHTLLASFVVIFIRVIVIKKGTNTLSVSSQAISSGVVRLIRFLWGKIRFLWLHLLLLRLVV